MVDGNLFNYLQQQPLTPGMRLLTDRPVWTQLRFLRVTNKVSFLALAPHKPATLVRSAGTAARILHFDWAAHTVSLALPSGYVKNLSVYTLVTSRPVAFAEKKLMANTKAGANLARGRKSITRGVAKNPVDHPHGGRTKAIRYPRTP